MRGKGSLMNCADIVALSPLYLSGELDEVRAKEFQAHLISCASCCRELGLQAELDARLRNCIFAADVSTDHSALDRRIRASLPDVETRRQAAHIRAFPVHWRLATAGVAMA